jgi:hypothetical protein
MGITDGDCGDAFVIHTSDPGKAIILSWFLFDGRGVSDLRIMEQSNVKRSISDDQQAGSCGAGLRRQCR